MNSKYPKVSFKIIFYIIAILMFIIMVLPFYWMVITSFKSHGVLFTYPIKWFPLQPTLDNYKNLFEKTLMIRWFLNSTIVAVSVVGLVILICMPAGYVFAKRDFPGKTILFLLLLSTLMIPMNVTLVPVFLLFHKIHILNTYQSLILPNIGSAFSVFLIVQYLKTIPDELIDAARIDGASELFIAFTIMLPLAKPAIAVLSLFKFLGSWNGFTWPLILISSKEMMTLSLGLVSFQGRFLTRWGQIMAGATLALLPLMILFLFLQKYFVRGIALTGLK